MISLSMVDVIHAVGGRSTARSDGAHAGAVRPDSIVDGVLPASGGPGSSAEPRVAEESTDSGQRGVCPDIRVTGVCTDSRAVRPGDLFIAIVGQRLDGHHFIEDALRRGAAACLVSRESLEAGDLAADDRLIMVDDTVEALGRLGAWYRREMLPRRTKVIGVTGSNGKTTAKLMMDHVLSAELTGRASIRSFNNAIGVPLTLLSAGFEDEYVVVEIGTNAPGEIEHLSQMVQPDVAVITSIGAAHLEGLGDVERVAAEKACILRHVRHGGLAVVNIDERALHKHLPTAQRSVVWDRRGADVRSFAAAGAARARPSAPAKQSRVGTGRTGAAETAGYRLCTVGRTPEAELYVAGVEGDLAGTSFVIDGDVAVRLRLPGPHHATNAALTYAVGRWMGLSAEVIGARLYSFTPAAGRTRRLDLGDVTVIDDCYNANPSSMMAALDILSLAQGRRRVFVMGDMLELGAASDAWHRRIGQCAADAGVEVMIAAGNLARGAAEAAASAGVPEIVICDRAADAADLAAQRIGDGDVVLVKGSRAMGLETVVARLEATLGQRRPALRTAV